MDLTRATIAVVDATNGQYTPEQVVDILDTAGPIIRSQVIAEYAEHLKDGIDDARNSGERHLYEDALIMLEAWGEE